MNKGTALYLLRAMRRRYGRRGLPASCCDLVAPSAAPYSRWTRGRLERFLAGTGIHASLSSSVGTRSGSLNSAESGIDRIDVAPPVNVCVSRPSDRPKSRAFRSTVYRETVPDNSFKQAAPGLFYSCPELLFAEMASSMSAGERLQLGFELCGCFSHDPEDPIDGPVTLHVPPVTSVDRIDHYLQTTRFLSGTVRARQTLRLLSDNAWSPIESVLATMMALSWQERGYELGRCTLNARVNTPQALALSTTRRARVPDILIEGTSVGINYDGADHLDLDAVAGAAAGLPRDAGFPRRPRDLAETMRAVRAKAVDDIRRNRELSADGLVIFQVVKEDLYTPGGLDRVMMQVLAALASVEGWDVADRLTLLGQGDAWRERQQLLYSMIPGGRGLIGTI